jgi:SAM-dependent methyltransferase
MKQTKDNFTSQAAEYAKYRPGYPAELFNYLLSLVKDSRAAWDCGTGNGQVAEVLAAHFDKVYATDISEKQLENAVQRPNIMYTVSRAEETPFPAAGFGLITVAQAIHWFDFDAFYQEVRRTIQSGGILAVIGYGLVRVNTEIDAIVNNLYSNIIGPFWDKERKYLDENYQTIPFPFPEITPPHFSNQYEWTVDEFAGYLRTWSAVQHYRKANHQDPVELITEELSMAWTGATRQVNFPILLRVAQVG